MQVFFLPFVKAKENPKTKKKKKGIWKSSLGRKILSILNECIRICTYTSLAGCVYLKLTTENRNLMKHLSTLTKLLNYKHSYCESEIKSSQKKAISLFFKSETKLLLSGHERGLQIVNCG